MAKMKVHELAKELDVQSKDILGFLQEKGIEAKAAQSSLDDDAVGAVRKKFSKAGAKVEKESPQQEKAAPVEKSEASNNAEPPKKKKIIFVSNPHNSKMPGQSSGQERRPAPQGNSNNSFRPQQNNNQSRPSQGSRTISGNNYGRPQLIKPHPEAINRPIPEKFSAKPEEVIEKVPVKVEEPVVNEAVEVKPAAPAPAVTNTQEAVKRPAENPINTESVQRTTRVNNDRPNTGRNNYNNRNAGGDHQNGQQDRNGAPRTYNNDRNNNYNNRGNGGYNSERSGNYNNDRSGGYNNNRSNGNYNSDRNSNGANGDRPFRQSNGQGGYNNYNNQDRPRQPRPDGERRPYQGNNGAPRGDRPAFNRDGARPQGQGRYQGNGGGMQGQGRPSFGGGSRPYSQGNGGNNAGRGGSGDRPFRPEGKDDRYNSRKQGQTKGFDAPIPGKDNDKRKDEEKRRMMSQEKDRRSKKDLIYEEDEETLAMKRKTGKFIKPEKKQEVVEEEIKVIVLDETVTIKDLADKMKIAPAAIIKKLFLQGQIVTVNQEISYEEAENIAIDYEIMCERAVKVDVIEELLKEEEEKDEDMVSRPPVICVMGHVDHGKTSLLDAIRKTNVTDREAGGITQHIGAYTVNINGRAITFLDTPGHEAFTAMRMRGANATDIAILVVAADDGVMPQTIEAINHAKAAGIEIVVAVNKIDKPNANPEKVKQELTEYDLIPVDWGGTTEFVNVSAKSGTGIDTLLETILLTADILELKANPKRRARGLVIEAQLDKGRGPVATILVQKGTLKVGDFISAGACHGKVRAMIDDKGKSVKEAAPSVPVEILGLNDVPNAGDIFIAHDNDKQAKSFAETFVSQNKVKKLDETKAKMSLDDLFSKIQEGNLKELNLIIKADVQGSVEAVKQSLTKLSNEEVIVKCIHGGVGAITESDVTLASASAAIIIGFNVRPDVMAKATAEHEGVDIRLYKVIYQAIEDIQAAMKGMLDPVFEEKVIGHAEVRQIFKASAVGNIAGSYVLDGVFQRGCKVRVTREGEQIYEGTLASLKRFKDDVKEVKTGFECGLVFDGFDQMQELDIVEAYIMVEVPR